MPFGFDISTRGVSFGSFDVGGTKQQEVFVLPTKPSGQQTSYPEDVVITAFWWVATTSTKKEANMALEVIQKNGVCVPVLKNSCPLEPFVKLIRFIPEKKNEKIETSEPPSAKGSKQGDHAKKAEAKPAAKKQRQQ